MLAANVICKADFLGATFEYAADSQDSPHTALCNYLDSRTNKKRLTKHCFGTKFTLFIYLDNRANRGGVLQFL